MYAALCTSAAATTTAIAPTMPQTSRVDLFYHLEKEEKKGSKTKDM